jgi:hypothetical protein
MRPEEAVDPRQPSPPAFPFQNGHLMTKSQDFQRCIEATSEEHSEGSENGEQ